MFLVFAVERVRNWAWPRHPSPTKVRARSSLNRQRHFLRAHARTGYRGGAGLSSGSSTFRARRLRFAIGRWRTTASNMPRSSPSESGFATHPWRPQQNHSKNARCATNLCY